MSEKNKSIFPERIAFVDDDEDIRYLARCGFEEQEDIVFMTCQSGEELLLRIRELQPDLIILDMRLKGMDGVDTLQALREHPDAMDIPVVFITGKQDLNMIERYHRLGVIGVIHKPVNPSELALKIMEIWRKKDGKENQDEAPTEKEND